MAKTYAFRFVATPAEFKDGIVSMQLSLMIRAPSEDRAMTWEDAKRYLPEFSAKMPGPHVASIHMANRRERKPAGFDAVRSISKREA